MPLLAENPNACALLAEAAGGVCCCPDSSHMSSSPPKRTPEHLRSGARHIRACGPGSPEL